MTICLLLAFPTCWIPPGGQTRYFTPLYPCLAVLIGVVVDRSAEADASQWVYDAWRRYVTVAACGMIACGVAVVIVSIFLANHPKLGPWAEPPFVAVGYAVAAGVTAVLAWRARPGGDAKRVGSGVVGIAWFTVITLGVVVNDVKIHQSENQAAAMSRLKEKLPADCRLVSIGHIDALFAYHFGALIETQPVPKTPDDTPRREYFCFGVFGDSYPDLPFAWEVVDTISMDRKRHAPPKRTVVVGRVMR